MKDIKFRAYITNGLHKNRLYNVEAIHFKDKFIYVNDNHTRVSIDFNECKLMQYTGLKDYKGRELYEGDIIETFIEGDGINRGDIQFDYGVFGIEWADFKDTKTLVGTWGQKHNLKRLDSGILDKLKIEIIGNIYQNPELLEKYRIKTLATFYIAPNPEKGQK